MRKTAIAAATLAVMASSLAPLPALAQQRGREDEEKKQDNTGAIVAGIAAIGIGIAIATSKKGDDDRYESQWDGNLYGDPFSPARDVTCVPRQRKCYERGHLSYSWTKRIFGNNAGFGGSGGSWDNGNGFGGSGGSWDNGQNLDTARRVCIDRGYGRGLRNIVVESVRPEGSSRARVYMQSRRSQMTVNAELWRCEYRFDSGRTEFKRM